ncbi:MAG: putative ribokinase [Candidatus Brocadia fulgida]|uniref:Ribokinase n=1 Tax=Candidatus Brocadia fulgida TaxID=380242 RepID=A0A0M2UW41_9BACT|nr:MAG: putative ribokinase [Candidatus Brocadia fulgida]
MKHNASFQFNAVDARTTLAIIAPGNLGDMVDFSNTYKKKGIDYIFDPGQSLPAWTKDLLTELIHGSKIFICNDYELQLTQEKTSMTIDDILKKTKTLIVTKGEYGSVVMQRENDSVCSIDIPVAKTQQVTDPTGAGDAYRAGLIKGLVSSKKDIVHAAKIGAVCAAYCVEVYGPQNFHFTHDSFNERFASAFGEKAF